MKGKKLAYAAIIPVCLGVAYYLGIFLPKTHDFKMQEKCAKLAKEFFNNSGYGRLMAQGSDIHYESHYNKKLNKFFILVTTTGDIDNDNTHKTYRTLVDILENKLYASSLDDSGDRDFSNSPAMREQKDAITKYMRE